MVRFGFVNYMMMYKDTSGTNYFYWAHELLAWMRRTFTTYLTITGSQGDNYGANFPTYLANKKGIYIMIPNYPGRFFASGHADYWNGVSCIGDCFFNIHDAGGVHAVYFWQLN